VIATGMPLPKPALCGLLLTRCFALARRARLPRAGLEVVRARLPFRSLSRVGLLLGTALRGGLHYLCAGR
jgi:hypothetical protein